MIEMPEKPIGQIEKVCRAMLGNDWYARAQKNQTLEKPNLDFPFDRERILNVANLLYVHPTIVEGKFSKFPEVVDLGSFEITGYNKRTEKILIAKYNNTFNKDIEKVVLLQLYMNIEKKF
jgi:hypothetical protein